MTHPPALQIWNFLMKNRKSLNSGLMNHVSGIIDYGGYGKLVGLSDLSMV